MNDLFYLDLEPEICNVTDYTTIYKCEKSIDTVIVNLEEDLQIILDWFKENGMYANPEAFQTLFLGFKSSNSFCLYNDWRNVRQSDHVKLLGVLIDSELSFGVDVKERCQKIHKNYVGCLE